MAPLSQAIATDQEGVMADKNAKLVPISTEAPAWLTVEETPPVLGRKAGTGPTQTMIMKIFDAAEVHGITTLQPVQIFQGARQLFKYPASKETLKECLKKLVSVEMLERTEDGYRRKK